MSYQNPTSGLLGAAACVWVALLLTGATSHAAQGYKAEVVGIITDTAGAVIEDARVVATNLETNVSAETRSTSEGRYVVPQLPPGRYRVTAEAPGFKTFVRDGVTVEVEQEVRVDAALEPGAISETVIVRDEAPAIETETAELGATIASREVLDLPLDGRNYLDLALLAPGVVPSSAGANPHNINGARSDYVNYLVDGISNVNRRGNEPVTSPPIDAIREFRVATSSHSAEHGRLGGGVISVALRGGTNELHGSLYEFHRNGALDARGFFDDEVPHLVRNQFGGTVGGPVVRDRTFFFFGYEGLRNVEEQTRLTRVPTAAERRGVFATPIRNPFTRQPFPDNTIPAELLDPVALAILPFLPEPNRAGVLNFSTSQRLRDETDSIVAKVDHDFGESDRLSVRTLFDRADRVLPFRATDLPGFGSTRAVRRVHVSASYTKVFSPSVVNEARVGFLRDDFVERSANAGRSTSAEVGIMGVAPGFGLANLVVAGLPAIGDAAFLPDEWTDNEIVVSDTLSVAAGSHVIRAGGELQRSQHFNLFAAFAGGQLVFNGLFSGSPFADFLLGLPIGTQRQVGTNKSYMFGNFLGLFVEDRWAPLPSLTLSLGVRYDVNQPAAEKYDRWANFLPDEGRRVTAGRPDLPRALIRTDRNNISPRFGFAWRPFGDTRTAVRGAYGIYHSYDLQFTAYQFLGANAFPFTRLEQYLPLPGAALPRLATPFPESRTGVDPGATTPSGWDVENPTPYVQNWNLTVGRELAEGLGVEVSYVGSKGTHLSSTANINQTIRTPEGDVRPFPGFGRILYQSLGASSIYHALQVTVERRFRAGLGFRSSYTLSKSLDDATFGSPARQPQDPRNLRAERGRSEFDRRHAWTSDVLWEIPFGQGRSGVLAAVAGGWQVNGIVVVYSGRPFTPVVAAAQAQAQAGFATRPDRLGSGELDDPTIDRWFDVEDFAVVPPEQFRFGTSGRNILSGPGLVRVDMSVFKEIRMPWEGHALQFRAEAFNLPNRANFGQPDARVDQPTAGRISSAAPGRRIQLAVKYRF